MIEATDRAAIENVLGEWAQTMAGDAVRSSVVRGISVEMRVVLDRIAMREPLLSAYQEARAKDDGRRVALADLPRKS